LRTAPGVDHFVANSDFIRRRIHKVYGRDAAVVHPPVDVSAFPLRDPVAGTGSVYLTASRMVPYKRVPLIVEAFSRMPDKQLVVIGDGSEYERCKAKAGPNVKLLGYQGQAELVRHMQQARAFVFAAEEDFGITPVEAQACGTPVIAYGRGGSLETVRGLDAHGSSRTGLFFHEQSVQAIVDAVQRFEALPQPPSAQACREHAERFAVERFRAAFVAEVSRMCESRP
jgi:glycosyltransferase involved in cell wall biosynthesis